MTHRLNRSPASHQPLHFWQRGSLSLHRLTRAAELDELGNAWLILLRKTKEPSPAQDEGRKTLREPEPLPTAAAGPAPRRLTTPERGIRTTSVNQPTNRAHLSRVFRLSSFVRGIPPTMTYHRRTPRPDPDPGPHLSEDQAIHAVLRAARHLSNEAWAELAGVSAQTVYNLRTGRVRYPRYRTLVALARAVGLSLRAYRAND